MSELTKHIGHRLVLLDERRLRCHDCTHTVLLPALPGTTSTSSPIAGPGEPRCPTHPHEHAHGCRPCAADRKATTQTTAAKPLAGWAKPPTQRAPETP